MSQVLDDELLGKDLKTYRIVNFKKAKFIYKSIFGLIGLSVFMALIFDRSVENNVLRDYCIGLPILLGFLLSPIGLYLISRSYYKKELPLMQIFWYLFGFVFLNLVVIGFITAIAKDIL